MVSGAVAAALVVVVVVVVVVAVAVVRILEVRSTTMHYGSGGFQLGSYYCYFLYVRTTDWQSTTRTYEYARQCTCVC